MTTLFGRKPQDSYPELLTLNNNGLGLDTTLRAVQDGNGISTPLSLSTNAVALNGLQWPATAATGQFLRVSSTAGLLEWAAVGSLGQQNSSAVAITGGSITGMPTPTNASDIATKAYVDGSGSSSGFQTGYIKYSTYNPGAGWIAASGGSVPRGTYPALDAVNTPPVIDGTTTFTKTAVAAFAGGVAINIAASNSTFVAGFNTGGVAYSANGTTWTTATISNIGSNAVWMTEYLNGNFLVGAASTGLLAKSTNGSTWTSVTSPFGNGVRCAAYGNGKYVVGFMAGKVAVTTDLVNWTPGSSTVTGASADFEGIAYGNGIFVAGNLTGTNMQTSPDGITWTARPAPIANGINSICFANGIFVAGCSGTNKIVTSPDGITWTAQTTPFTGAAQIVTVRYVGVFMAGSDGGAVAYSKDGITWTALTSTSTVAYGFAQLNGLIVNSAGSGSVQTMPMFTYDAVNRIKIPNMPAYTNVTAYIKT